MFIKSTLLSLSFRKNISSLASFLSVRMEPHLSIFETDWKHSSSRAHNLSTPCHFLCVLIEKTLFLFFFFPANKMRLPILVTLASSEGRAENNFLMPINVLLHHVCSKGLSYSMIQERNPFLPRS